jgi:hypothetical protein
LYLFGKAGIGKSFIVQRALDEFNLRTIFMPVPRHFFFSDFDSRIYDCVLFEEFEYETYKSNIFQIKRLLEGRDFAVDEKYKSRRVIKVKVPVIFVSNECPYGDEAFLCRLEVINALESMEKVPKIRVPEEEVDGPETMEVIEVPSDTEIEEDENEENICPN